MSKELINFSGKAETELVKEVFLQFVSNYGDTIRDYLNMSIGNDGTPVDAAVAVVNGEIVIHQLSPDKGFVLGEVDNVEVPVQVTKYTDVEVGKRYVLQQKDRLVLYIKTEEGKPDVSLGAFKTITDTVIAFNSDGVKNQMTAYAEKVARETKADEKAAKRLAKLTPAKAND